MGTMRWSPRMSRQAALLSLVHERPGITRAAVARELSMPSGYAAETVARLVASSLLTEQPVAATGHRGRPTASLHPHPRGPLVAVAAIAHENWRVDAVQVGGTSVASTEHAHRRHQRDVLRAVATELDALGQRFGRRIQAVAVSVPGTVVGTRLVQAPNLGWHDVDLSVLWPRYDPDGPVHAFIAGNDATFAAIAESRRGAAMGAGTMVHVYLDAGVGGAIVTAGRALPGADGMAGEFGHMPFGDPSLPCRCGASGCWNTSMDGQALARAMGDPLPGDEVSYARAVLSDAQNGREQALAAVGGLATALGRGCAGLVNALDPHVVTVGGLGRDVLGVAGEQAASAYLRGMMAFRVSPPPRLMPAHFATEAPLVGAAEEAFAGVLGDEGVERWSSRPG
jgi:predicted NBD/HSP70 family sugar kinase